MSFKAKLNSKFIKFYFLISNSLIQIFIMSKPASNPKFDVKPYLKSGLTEEQILEVKENFDMLDSLKIGSISAKKLKDIISHSDPEAKNKSIYRLICDLDCEGSGNISFDQFLHLNTRRLIEDDSLQNLKFLFALFDDDKTGYVSIQSLRRKACQLGMELDEKDFQDMISSADKDKDGLISEAQFCQLIRSLALNL